MYWICLRGMGSQYGLLVLLKIPVLGMSYDTHGIFYIPVNFVFSLPNYVTSYMHYSGKKKSKVTICFQGIRTRTLQSLGTETLLSTSIFSKKSIFNAALCRFKYSDWARAEHPKTTCGGSLQLFHTSYVLHPLGGSCFYASYHWAMRPLHSLKFKINSVEVIFSAIHTVWTLWSLFNMNSKIHLRKNSGKDFQLLCLGYSSLLFLCSSVSCYRR